MSAIRRALRLARRVSKGLGRRWRGLYYPLVLGHVGRNCVFNEGLLIAGPEHISLGDGVVLNDGAILQSSEGAPIRIGHRVHLAYGATVITGNLDMTKGWIDHERHVGVPVTIGDGAVIGTRAVLMPGSNVGEGAVVSAGSVVTGPVKPHTLVFGNPARPLKELKPPPAD